MPTWGKVLLDVLALLESAFSSPEGLQVAQDVEELLGITPLAPTEQPAPTGQNQADVAASPGWRGA